MIGTSLCPPREDLLRFLVGQLSDEEADGLEEHLAGCAACVESLASLRCRDQLVEAVTVAVRSPRPPIEEVREDLLRALYRLPEADSRTRDTPLGEMSPLATPPAPLTQDEQSLDFLTPAQEPSEIGRFGSYRILRQLGAGGMGVVLAARQERPRRVVALKVMAPGRNPGRFRSETEIVARLRHPNIVPIHEVGEQNGRLYFTMEYADGGSLAQKLAVAPLPPREAAELVEVLARAVGFAHEQGVIHRDLKPSNILLASGGREPPENHNSGGSRPPLAGNTPKIADFGLAKQLGEEAADPDARTHSGAILGTPAYMAPEQAAGRSGQPGRLMDVYALGAILYECLTGRPPFRAATVLDTLDLVRRQEPLPPTRLQPGLPRDLQTICLKCLEKEPARRYASAVEMADDLGRFLRGEPIRARPVSWRERMWKWARRQPALAILLGVGALLLGVLVAGALVYESSLRHAVRLAEEKESEARKQQGRADRGYRTASDTLNRMLARLEARQVGEAPQLKELQRELLQDVLPFFQQALDEADGSDPVVQRDTAHACKRMGNIQHMLGQTAAAAESYRRAIALVEGLPDAEAKDQACRCLVCGCHTNLGLLAGDARRWDEAERHHRTSLAIQEQLAQLQPDSPDFRGGIAECEHNLGVVFQLSGRLAAAEPHYTRAATIRAELVRAYPREERYQAALAQDYVNLAEIYKFTRRLTEAIQSCEKADGLLRSVLNRHPNRGDVALTLAALNTNWSFILRATGKSQDALTRLGEAVDLTEGVLRREPKHRVARLQTYNAHGARAQAYEALGRWADAARDWDRVIELDTQPNPWIHKVFRALALARAGEHARAAAEAGALAKQPEVSDQGQCNLACVYALASKASESGKELSPTERQVTVDRYGSEAVGLLRKVQARGYFKDMGNAWWLLTHKDLDPLRRRTDFAQLLSTKPDSKQP